LLTNVINNFFLKKEGPLILFIKYSISGPYFFFKKLFITFVNNRAPMVLHLRIGPATVVVQ